jgi:hypothetical protein
MYVPYKADVDVIKLTHYLIPFIIFEIPSNLVIKKMLASRFQSRIMVNMQRAFEIASRH